MDDLITKAALSGSLRSAANTNLVSMYSAAIGQHPAKPDDVLEFETDTERRELTVDISLLSDDFPSVVICIDKQRAEQIVNHLIKVFDITPLHD